MEIIVVDDGLTDNTHKEVNKIKDERVKHIKLMNNTGASNARNIGLNYASGRYISFQDSDDIIMIVSLSIISFWRENAITP